MGRGRGTIEAEGRIVHMRWGPGPVFVYEWLVRSRNWRMYGQRVLFTGAILAGLILMWTMLMDGPNRGLSARGTATIDELARLGQAVYGTMVVIELTMILLVAPAATAGAVCTDKVRGTLEHMLVTDLSNVEIVLGKLAVRLAPVLALIACVLPITALAGLFGGIDPLALGGSFLVAAGCAVLACALALLLSVWGRKAHEVLMLTYVLIILWLITPIVYAIVWEPLVGGPYRRGAPSLAWTIWEYLFYSNPYVLVFAPYNGPGTVGWTTYFVFLGVCLGLSALMAGWATLRVRAVAARQAGAGARPREGRTSRRAGTRLDRLFRLCNVFRFLPGPSLDGNPVLWREWHRARPSRMLRAAWLMYTALGLFELAMVFHEAVTPRTYWQDAAVGMAAYSNTFQVGLGLLLLSVGASTSLSEERARGSLDLVMSTPLSTRSILAGKWWGTFRQAGRVLIWPALIGALLVLFDLRRAFLWLLSLGLISAYAAAVVSLGLMLAVCVRQAGRAVALCVTIVVGLSIGWVFLIVAFVIAMGAPHDRATEGLVYSAMMGSPLAGTPMTTMAMDLSHAGNGRGPVDLVWTIPSACAWTMALWGVAGVLYLVALGEFEPRLGRMPEEEEILVRPRRRRPRPAWDARAKVDGEDEVEVDEDEDEGAGPLNAEGVTVLGGGAALGPSADGIVFLDAGPGASTNTVARNEPRAEGP